MIKNLGTEEVILVSIILFFLFGSKKIPEFLRGIAEAINEFRHPKNKEVDNKRLE